MITFAHTTNSKPLSVWDNPDVRTSGLQFLKFVLGGAVNTAATYVLFVGLSFALPSSVAYTIAYVAGIGLSYLINTFFVFQVRTSLRAALKFPAIYLVQYVFGLIALVTLTNMGLDSRIAMLAVIALNIPVTFVLTRFVLQGTRKQTSEL
jgi:putative flippase GtrA